MINFIRMYVRPPPPPPPFPPFRLAILLALLLASTSSISHSALLHLHFRLANLANSSPNSSPTAQLSAHCWTSTCELPSSVCTARPQRTDRMPENIPYEMLDKIPENMPDKMPWNMPARMPEGIPNKISDKISDRIP